MTTSYVSLTDRARAAADAKIATADLNAHAAVAAQEQSGQARVQVAEQQARDTIAEANAYVSPMAATADEKNLAATQATEEVAAATALYSQQLSDARQQAIAAQVDIKVAAASQAAIPLYAIVDIPAGRYQSVFDAMSARGYRLVSFNAHVSGAELFYNVIWEANNTLSWYSWNQLSPAQLQQKTDEMVSRGFRPYRIHSYLWQNQFWYAAIFVKEASTPRWQFYYGATVQEHQDRFTQLTQQGLSMVNWSVTADLAGTPYVAALYRQVPGTWSSVGMLSEPAYQAVFNEKTRAGMALADLSVTQVNGRPTFFSIWNSVRYGAWTARHNMDTLGYLTDSTSTAQARQWIRVLTTYLNGDTVNYAALWAAT